jgi:hypothetical protein
MFASEGAQCLPSCAVGVFHIFAAQFNPIWALLPSKRLPVGEVPSAQTFPPVPSAAFGVGHSRDTASVSVSECMFPALASGLCQGAVFEPSKAEAVGQFLTAPKSVGLPRIW